MQNRQGVTRKSSSGCLELTPELAHEGKLLKNKKVTQMSDLSFSLWEQRDSNPWPSACKADALNQLSYAPEFLRLGRCKGKHYFLNLQIFDKLFFQRVSSSFEAWPHLLPIGVQRFLHHPMAVTIAAYRLLPRVLCDPRTWAPEQGLEPRTPWLTVMCSNQLSYSGIIKNRYLSIAVQR